MISINRIKLYYRKIKTRLCLPWLREVGFSLPYLFRDPDMIQVCIDAVKADARYIMPPNRFIEVRRKIPTDFGRNCAVAWYWYKGMPNGSFKGEEEYNGYTLLERFLI